MKIRTLDEIQAKIVDVHNRKPSIFYDKVRRLMNLRKDEFNSIDQMLLETHTEYQQLAVDSLLQTIHFEWKMKVNGTRPDDESSERVAGLRGYVDENGIMRCIPYKKVKTYGDKDPVRFEGVIDHLGTVFMNAISWEEADKYRAPVSFYAGSGNKGQLVFVKNKEETRLSKDLEIAGLSGNMYGGREAELSRFMLNRDRMIRLINLKRVKI